MSKSLVGGSMFARRSKAECPRCKRTVVQILVEGVAITTDTELIAVIVQGQKQRVLARRVHGELCEKYKLDAEKKAFALEQRKAVARMPPSYAVTATTPRRPERSVAEIRKSLAANYREVEKARASAWKRAGL